MSIITVMEQQLQEIPAASDETRIKIAPYRGGLVTSFSVSGSEILYLDPETFADLSKNVRGGIPLLFPNAGPSQGCLYTLPQHGFVRKMPWQITTRSGSVITLQLKSDAGTRVVYPFDFELNLTVTVLKNRLTHCLTVTNLSDKPMPTAYGTHPYFNIAQAEKQKLTSNIVGFNPQMINWQNGFDQCFANPGSIHIEMPDKELFLESDSAIFKFVRIWHLPGKDYVCIEPWTRDSFAIDDPKLSLNIPPHESRKLSFILRAKMIK